MEPYYLGEANKRLFAVYHAPYSQRSRNVGVILCYPFGQEYIWSHRALVRLAIGLASKGFHALRFDFYGCGDSEGNLDEVSIKYWINNIHTAINEIKKKCYVDQICLVGLRLGATLSALYASEDGSTDGLILWNPIIKGMDYIKELKRHHRISLLTTFAEKKKNNDHLFESEGFPIPIRLLSELESIDLIELKPMGKSKVLLLDKEVSSNIQQLRLHFSRLNTNVKIENTLNNQFWWLRADKSMVPIQEIDTIIKWISKEFQ